MRYRLQYLYIEGALSSSVPATTSKTQNKSTWGKLDRPPSSVTN